MRANSRQVSSNQPGLHGQLDSVVRRHLASRWQSPIAEHTQRAFDGIRARVEAHAGPIILDSGCGTGASALRSAQRHPAAMVIGVDRSEARLARGRKEADNLLLVRAELADFWRLAAAARWRLDAHHLYYPNPSPKAAHLKRRWYGHPVFPAMLTLGGRIEARSNWQTYLDEFRHALHLAGFVARVDALSAEDRADPVSPFEAKYIASGQRCWRLVCDLDAGSVDAGSEREGHVSGPGASRGGVIAA